MNTDRAILHSDCNSFYASVEQCEHPELRGKPIVVGGEPELRHGIVLTKSKEAKASGIKTAETLWQARQKCADLIIVPPDYPLYMRYSRLARDIYYQYTPRVEPFGLDECWLDVTKSLNAWCGDPLLIAAEISERMKAELGITVSIGVSWNKIFAKFGSDYKKPDAITSITRANFRSVVWNAPVEELLYVGPATKRKLNDVLIYTIGDLACADGHLMQRIFGKIGPLLQTFARGEDTSPVKYYDMRAGDVSRFIKSYGNGLTAPHDIRTLDDARALLMLLSESVAQRMRSDFMCASCVGIAVRWAHDLHGYTKQATLARPSCLTQEIYTAAESLLRANEPCLAARPLRALHVRVSRLSPVQTSSQLDLFGVEDARLRALALERAIDSLRRRFGNSCITRGTARLDTSYADLGVDIVRDNVVHPIGLLGS